MHLFALTSVSTSLAATDVSVMKAIYVKMMGEHALKETKVLNGRSLTIVA